MIKGEFDMIAEFFLPLTQGRDDAGDLQDDGAILQIPENYELVVSTDTLNAGVHFLADARAADIAHKALRANLSDLAAMGADPYCYQLAIAFPEEPNEAWLEEFTVALLADQKEFGIFCSGGDTTSIKGALSISITAMGTVPKGQAVKRSGAQVGDKLLLTGPVGDAYIGLKALKGELDNCFNANVVSAYLKPVPRLDMALRLRTYAHAAIDISDGLVADLAHICHASDVRADVQISDALFSKSGNKLIETGAVSAEELIAGGDDYQLLLAVSPEAAAHFPDAQIIGEFHDGAGVTIKNKSGEMLDLKHTGWSHF